MRLLSPKQYDDLFDKFLKEFEDEDNQVFIYRRIAETFGEHFAFSTSFGGNGKEDFYVYRVITEYEELETNANKLLDPSSFSYNPEPPLGRANLKNEPVFYCSDWVITSIKETKELKDEAYYISTWKVKGNKEVNAFLMNYDSVGRKDFLSETINFSLSSLTEFTEEQKSRLKYMQKKITDLFTYKGDKFYNISSAIAHKLLYETKKQGIDVPWLIYPSVASKQTEYNFAMHPSFVNNPDWFTLVSVVKCNLEVTKEDKYKGDIFSKAVLQNDELKWGNISTKIKSVDYKNVGLATAGDDAWVVEDAEKIRIQINNIEYGLKNYLSEYYLSTLNIEDQIDINKLNIFDESLSYSQEGNLIIEFGSNFRILKNGDKHLRFIKLKIILGVEFT